VFNFFGFGIKFQSVLAHFTSNVLCALHLVDKLPHISYTLYIERGW